MGRLETTLGLGDIGLGPILPPNDVLYRPSEGMRPTGCTASRRTVEDNGTHTLQEVLNTYGETADDLPRHQVAKLAFISAFGVTILEDEGVDSLPERHPQHRRLTALRTRTRILTAAVNNMGEEPKAPTFRLPRGRGAPILLAH